MTVYETPQEARPVRAFLHLAVHRRLPLYLPAVYASTKVELEAYTKMKRSAIKRRSLANTTFAGLEPEAKPSVNEPAQTCIPG